MFAGKILWTTTTRRWEGDGGTISRQVTTLSRWQCRPYATHVQHGERCWYARSSSWHHITGKTCCPYRIVPALPSVPTTLGTVCRIFLGSLNDRIRCRNAPSSLCGCAWTASNFMPLSSMPRRKEGCTLLPNQLMRDWLSPLLIKYQEESDSDQDREGRVFRAAKFKLFRLFCTYSPPARHQIGLYPKPPLSFSVWPNPPSPNQAFYAYIYYICRRWSEFGKE